MVKYSFVLPAYKARYFREAIDSILNQTYSDFELIIVNDSSPEDLDSIVNNYNDGRIRYYKNDKNIGGKDLIAQWNLSLSYAIGEYVILASDDDVYSPLYLEEMDGLVCKYPEVYVFRPRIQIIDSSSSILYQFGTISENVGQIEYIYHWMRGCVGSGIGHFIFNREALVSQGGFFSLPLAWGSDDVTVINMAKNGIVFSPHILFSFRKSGINITSKTNDVVTLRKKWQSYKIFEVWLEELVGTLGEGIDDKNDFYNYIKRNYKETFMAGLVVGMLKSSSVYAILNNLKYYFRLRCVPCFKGSFWLLRELIGRISFPFKGNSLI